MSGGGKLHLFFWLGFFQRGPRQVGSMLCQRRRNIPESLKSSELVFGNVLLNNDRLSTYRDKVERY
jgi:hypothetical protein